MYANQALRQAVTHWPEYLMEAGGLGMFMISASVFGTLLEHPASAVNRSIDHALARRALMGLAMGSTAIAIICSPWGQRSGAHLNPAVTLTFCSLGKIGRWDTFFYVLAQFLGALMGMAVAEWIVGPALGHSSVNYVVTVPGTGGAAIAFLAETLISMILMLTVLIAANSQRLARWTPWLSGWLVACFIFFEAPVSGMSMNPARTFGSAFSAGEWTAIWLYFVAPLLGMMTAACFYRYSHGAHRVLCAKLHHHNLTRCIFHCQAAKLFEEIRNREVASRHSEL